jgi:hypothetical protein
MKVLVFILPFFNKHKVRHSWLSRLAHLAGISDLLSGIAQTLQTNAELVFQIRPLTHFFPKKCKVKFSLCVTN